MAAWLDLFERDILFRGVGILPAARATACSAAAALVPRRRQIRRHNMVLPVLLFPRSGLGAVGNLLRAIGFYFAGILFHAGELAAVGGVVFRGPVAHFLLDRLLPISGIRVVAQQLWSAFAVFLFQLLEGIGHRLR